MVAVSVFLKDTWRFVSLLPRDEGAFILFSNNAFNMKIIEKYIYVDTHLPNRNQYIYK